MPEGPEIKLMTLKLQKLKNCIVQNIKVLGGRYTRHGNPENFQSFKKALPLKINSVNNKGKFIYFILENGWYIMFTMGMTGKIVIHDKPIKHDNILFETNKGPFYFNDQRNFGTVKFTKNKEEFLKKLDSLGLDFLSNNVSKKEFIKHFEKFNQKQIVGKLLLNQGFIAGVGNYLRSDTLYCAKISPFRELENITADELGEFYKCLKKTIRSSYSCQINSKNKCKFIIYKQKEDSKGNPVLHEKILNGRTIWYVPKIQK